MASKTDAITATINAKALAGHLEKVYLDGVVNECVIACVDDQLFTTAVDQTNSLFIHVATPFPGVNLGTLGLGNLGVLVRFLESIPDDATIKYDQHKLTIKAPTGPALRYLLALPDLIPSYDPEHVSALPNLIEQAPFSVPIQKSAITGFLQMMGLLKSKLGMLTVVPGHSMLITGGLETEHQFVIDLGAAPAEVESEVTIRFFADHLRSVLSTVREKDLFLWFAHNRPIIVSIRDEDAGWALAPVQE